MAQRNDAQDTRLRNRVRAFLDLVQESNQKRVAKACSELASEFPKAHLAKVRTEFYPIFAY